MPSKFTLRVLLLVQFFVAVFGLGALKAQVVPDSCPVSQPLSITVHQEPDVSTAGASTICEGGNDTLTATIIQPGTGVCHIQWQSSPDGTSNWQDIAGATSATYITPALNIGDNTYFRVRYYCDAVSGADINCDEDFSNVQHVIVIEDAVVDVGQANYQLCNGGTLTFTANVTNGTGNISYQWQSSTDNSNWTNVGTNANTYTTPALTATTGPVTTYYRVLISQDGAGCNNTQSQVITVVTYPDPIINIGAPDTLCVGGLDTLTATVEHGIGTCGIQWQYLDGATWTDIPGATSATLYTGALTQSRVYRAIYDCDGLDCDAYVSNLVQITITNDPSVSIAGGEITICESGGATLNANVTGGAGTPSYQWESSLNGTDWNVISGATAQSLTVTGLTQTTYYRVRVVFSASGCDPVYSGVSTINVVPDPDVNITGHEPVCTDGSVTMTANVSGGTGTCTITWQRLVGSVWQDIAGANAATYTTPNLTITTSYRVRYSCTGGGCDASFSDPVTIDVIQDPTITDQPLGEVICVGGSHTMEVTATGGTPGILYQWQYFNGTTWANVTDGTPTGADFTGETTNQLTVSGISVVGSYDFRVYVDAVGSDCDTMFSDVATIDVVKDPEIDTQPLGDTICVGGQHIMNVVASGGTGGLFYQWEYNNGGTWEPVADGTPTGAAYTGADTDQLTVDGISVDGTYDYRVVVTSPGSNCDTEVSNTVTITVEPALNIVANPVGDSICVDGQATFTATITGGSNLTYQWQILNGASWQNVANGYPTGAAYTGITTNTLNVSGIDLSAVGNYQYQLVVTSQGNNCGSVTTDTARLVVRPPLEVAVQPVGDSICVGGSHTVSVNVTGGNTLSYQWQILNGASWQNVADGFPTGATYTGENAATMVIAGITQTGFYQYQVVVSSTGDNCTTITSDTAGLSVSPALAVADQPDGAAICVDGTHTMSATITGGNALNYQWQILNGASWQNVANGFPTGATYTGANTASLTATGFDNPGAYQYQLVVTTGGNNCGSITTDTALVTVVADPAVDVQPVGDSICVGGTTDLTLTASGGTPQLNIQWEYRDNGLWLPVTANLPTGASYSGATTNSLNVTGITQVGNHEYRAVLTAAGNNCNTATSATVIVTVEPDPAITVQPVGATICRGGDHTFTVTATGGTPGLDYEWQYFNGTSWNTVANGTPTGATYTSATPNQLFVSGIDVVGNHLYRVIVTSVGSGCNPVTSAVDTIIVNQEISATLAQEDQIVCEEGTTVITATVTGGTGTPTYQWEYRDATTGGAWQNVTGGSGANTPVLTTPELLTTTEFRLIINYSGSGCDAYVSQTVEVEVVPDPTVSINGVTDVCVGGGVLISANVAGGTGQCEVQWQISTNNGSTFSDIVPPATGPTYQTPPLNANTQYRARIVCDGKGCCD